MPPSKSVIITGGSTGLGFEAAKAVIGDPSVLAVLACRNPELGQGAVQKLVGSGGNAVFLTLDLGDQSSVHRFVDQFRSMECPPLTGIICNAGMQNVADPTNTAQGYEATFAVNHLGHYLLTRLLLDDLEQGGSITLVSSGTHDPKEKTGMPEPVYRDAQSVAHNMEPGRPAGLRRYTTSKLCNVFFTYELARRLAASSDARLKSITVNALDPGLMPATGLARSWPAPLRWVSRNVLPLLRFVNGNVHSPEVSGKRLAALTVGADAKPGGRYFSNGRAVRSSDLSYDQAKQRELWVASAKMTGLAMEIGASQSKAKG